MAQKKILIITPFNPKYTGGAETFCFELFREANKHFNPVCITMKRQYKDWDNPGIFQQLHIAFVLFLRALTQRGYKTVNCHGVIATFVGVILKKLFGVKVVSTLLALYSFTDFGLIKLNIFRWILNNSDVVFVEDDLAERSLKKIGIAPNKIKKFMHWIDLERFTPGITSKHLITVLFIGRPIYKKGMGIIREAAKQINDAAIYFEFVQNMPYELLPAYYKSADIFVIPSLYDEGVTRVALEAAACGCCVIASNYGSLPYLVQPFGIVLDPTVKNFKAKILNLYNNRDTLLEYKKIAREYAEANFSNKNAEVILKEF